MALMSKYQSFKSKQLLAKSSNAKANLRNSKNLGFVIELLQKGLKHTKSWLSDLVFKTIYRMT